ncbi:hypothetical protein [Streptomyces atratus]|uniref:hypothetical protein n=1 Tax=Streptomyces atratus TaxID=1893 RepID=UPI0037AA21ED
MTVEQVESWSEGIAGFHARFAHRFGRSEPREWASDYLNGLLAPLENRNGWTLSEQAGQLRPDGVQRLTGEEVGGDHKEYEVSEQQNCFGQAKVGDRVEIRKDPLGLLAPRLPDSSDQENATEITVDITAGFLLLTAVTVFYGGQRRRFK